MKNQNLVKVIGHKSLVQYMDKLASDSKRKTMYGKATRKAAKHVEKAARRNFKKTRTGKFMPTRRRPQKLGSGGGSVKSNLSRIKTKAGKRKYRGDAWVLGGRLANILENIKGQDRVARKGKVIPILLKNGKLVFTKMTKAPKRNKYLSDAARSQKTKVKLEFKAELRTAIVKHAKKYSPGSRAAQL